MAHHSYFPNPTGAASACLSASQRIEPHRLWRMSRGGWRSCDIHGEFPDEWAFQWQKSPQWAKLIVNGQSSIDVNDLGSIQWVWGLPTKQQHVNLESQLTAALLSDRKGDKVQDRLVLMHNCDSFIYSTPSIVQRLSCRSLTQWDLDGRSQCCWKSSFRVHHAPLLKYRWFRTEHCEIM